MFLLTKSECAVPEEPFTPNTQEAGSSKEKPKCVVGFFLNKTISEKLLIAKYALRNILLGNGKIQKML